MRVIAISVVILSAVMVSVSGHREVTTPSESRPEKSSALHASYPIPKSTPGLQGYCWPLSAKDGERINFYVSGNGRGTARFFRHTANESGVVSIPMGFQKFSVTEQPTSSEAWRVGAGWRRSFYKLIPRTSIWPSGIYSAELTDWDGHKFYIPFIVKPRPRQRNHQVAVIANTSTWLAYNNWGGRSATEGAAHVSFLRPNPAASPTGSAFPYGHLLRGELWILGWLEATGKHPDVYADIDLHDAHGCGFPIGYSYIVLSTHPQYWTRNMFTKLDNLLSDDPVSLLYLGGNGIYERAELEITPLFRRNTDGRCVPRDIEEPLPPQGMTFKDGADSAVREIAFWRRTRPERSLLGVATERCGVQGAPYEVLQECHWLLAKTHLRNGDLIGERGLNTGCGPDCGDSNGGAAGWRIDTSNGLGARGRPTGPGCIECTPGRDCPPGAPDLSEAFPYPTGVTVLARGRNWRDGDTWKGAEMVYYDYPRGGGFVFSVGSIQFGGSLVVDRELQQILNNALAGKPTPAAPPLLELRDWTERSPRPIVDRRYLIGLKNVTFNRVCEHWYRVTFPPFHGRPSTEACRPRFTVSFSSGVTITRVEESGGVFSDRETYTTSPHEIPVGFLADTTNQVVLRVNGSSGMTYNLELTFSVPCP